MPDTKQISSLLKRTCDAHHNTFKQTGGVDVDWAIWYAKWLVDNPEATDVFGGSFAKAKFVYALMALDVDYTAGKPDEDWSDYYAQNIMKYLEKDFSN